MNRCDRQPTIDFAGGLVVVVYGSPAPQGSKSYKGHSKAGHAILVESSSAVRPWRSDVKAAAEALIWPVRAEWVPLDGSLTARMVFTLRRPLSAPKRRQTWPDRAPDLSKLVRSTEDALTDAGIWRDDARVVEYTRVAKVYPNDDPEALDAPGVRIVIDRKDTAIVSEQTDEQRGATWLLEQSCHTCGCGRYEYWAGDIRCVHCGTALPRLGGEPVEVRGNGGQ